MKRFMKFTVVFLICFSCENAKTQTDWIDFGNGESGQKPEIDMYSPTNFSIDFYGVNRYKKTENDTAYDVLLLPGNYGKTCDIGLPQLPILTYYVEVIVDTPIITVNSTDYLVLENYNLLPAQENETIGEGDTVTSFEKEFSIYSQDEFYPENFIMTSLPSICRNHRIITIVIFPIKINPVTKQLKALQHIDFTISGAGSIEVDIDNVLFDNFLKSNVINYSPNSNIDNNIDLLILTPDMFNESLLQYKKWKERAGFRTRIVTRSELEETLPPPNSFEWIADPV